MTKYNTEDEEDDLYSDHAYRGQFGDVYESPYDDKGLHSNGHWVAMSLVQPLAPASPAWIRGHFWLIKQTSSAMECKINGTRAWMHSQSLGDPVGKTSGTKGA